jgi:hypothetical protein
VAPAAGRRRFKRCAISLRKGSAKTELAAWMRSPSCTPRGRSGRTGGARRTASGCPSGGRCGPVHPDGRLHRGADRGARVRRAAADVPGGPRRDLFDAGKEQITRIYGDGKAEALAASPNSRRRRADDVPALRRDAPDDPAAAEGRPADDAANLPKRVDRRPWELETTTTYAEGEGSCAQDTHEYAERHRQGQDQRLDVVLLPPRGPGPRRRGPRRPGPDPRGDPDRVGPGAGPVVRLRGQVDSIASLYAQPDTDRAYFERVWLNRWVSSSRQAFDPVAVEDLARPDVPDRRQEASRSWSASTAPGGAMRAGSSHAHRDRLPVAAGGVGEAGRGSRSRRTGKSPTSRSTARSTRSWAAGT